MEHMIEAFITPLLECAEGAFVIEEETKKIIWVSEGMQKRVGDCIEMHCWQAFSGNDKQCSDCPNLKKNEVYTWERYEDLFSSWYKINNQLFCYEGIIYRIGVVTNINDVMFLTYDTVMQVSELQNQVAGNQKIREELEQRAGIDSMTGLKNRNSYIYDMNRGFYDGIPLGVLYFDLNNLKDINDQYQHDAGDRLIRQLANSLLMIVMEIKDAFIYRIGGDEFIILVKNASLKMIKNMKESFYEEMERQKLIYDISCDVAVGTAVSSVPCDVEDLIAQADKNMYLVKLMMKKNNQETEEK